MKDYERIVLKILLSGKFPADQIDVINRECEFVGYEYTGSGYFLKIRHPLFPTERMVLHEPIVMGEADGQTCGFVVFIEKNELVLECHSWGEIEVSENFRASYVQIRKATALPSGEVVPYAVTEE